MQIITPKQDTSANNKSPDEAWVESLSYKELMEHFRLGALRNKFHNGQLGKFFSNTMSKRRAELKPEEVAAIDAEIAKLEATINGTKQ